MKENFCVGQRDAFGGSLVLRRMGVFTVFTTEPAMRFYGVLAAKFRAFRTSKKLRMSNNRSRRSFAFCASLAGVLFGLDFDCEVVEFRQVF